MVLAGKTLFIAGPPDIVDEEEVFYRSGDAGIWLKLKEQQDAIEGGKGSMLWAVSTADGKKLAGYDLDSLPVFDGMIASNNKLYLSTKDGKVLCFAGGE